MTTAPQVRTAREDTGQQNIMAHKLNDPYNKRIESQDDRRKKLEQ